MAEHKKLVVLGVASLLVFLLSQMPASILFLALSPLNVQGFGVNGTVWNGSATIVNVGRQQIRNTEWDLAVGSLLLGRLGGDFKSEWGDGFAAGNGSLSVGGTIRLSELSAGVNAKMASSLFSLPAANGIVTVDIQQLVVANNWPQTLTGIAEVSGLYSTALMGPSAATMALDLEIEFDSETETAEGTITGRIKDTGGPVELNGTLTLTQPGNYDVNVIVKARPGAPAALQDNLKFIGTPDASGSRTFNLQGSI